MKEVRTQDAVGQVLCHDITRIIRGQVKDTPFRKGHVVTEEDVPLLLDLGKDHLYIWEKDENMLHEDEAALILESLCRGEHMVPSAVREGKIELTADCDGLYQIDVERLDAVNGIDEIMIASRHTNTAVKKGDKLLGTRVIPLVIAKEKLKQAREAAGPAPLARLIPYRFLTAGIITTGNEVYYGRIRDTFTPVVKEKLSQYGIQTMAQVTVNDERERITAAILEMKEKGIQFILCTGGMSVDPDDRTPGAIRASGAKIVTYGAPVLPGAMFLLGYFEDWTVIAGLPGCVMYHKATVFDLVLPRIAAGVRLTKMDFVRMGNGGLCLGCEPCRYPDCSFGKGC